MDVLEAMTGNRVNYGVGTIGGVLRDITPWLSNRRNGRILQAEFSYFYNAVTEDPIVKARMRNVGVLSERCREILCRWSYGVPVITR